MNVIISSLYPWATIVSLVMISVALAVVIFWQRRRINSLKKDHLTGLIGQNEYRSVFKRVVKRALKNKALGYEYNLYLIFGDIRDFKNHNTVLTHAGADEVLAVVGRKLQAQFRDGHAWVARKGGDEFVVLLELYGGKTARRDNLGGVSARLEKTDWTVFPRDGSLLRAKVGVRVDFSIASLFEVVVHQTRPTAVLALRDMLERASRRNIRAKEEARRKKSIDRSAGKVTDINLAREKRIM